MFLITAQFRAARSKRDADKEGVVFYQIRGQEDGRGRRIERDVNSDLRAKDSGVLKSERAEILSKLRLLYCVIERREDSGEPFDIDDIADDFRKALSGDEAMGDLIAKSRAEFPLRSDIVNVGYEFKGDFKFFFPKMTDVGAEDIFGYIFNLSKSLKNEGRESQAKNLLSLLSNLKLFAEGSELSFREFSREFVNRYAEWLKQTGISDSTQSFYLRNLRTVLNKARDNGLIGSTSGWFGEVNTGIGHPARIHDGKLNRGLIQKIEGLDLSGDIHASLVRDMFMFGFYCGGMELIDIANLQYSDIKYSDGKYSNAEGIRLVYRRRLKGLERSVPLGEQAMKIIERYRYNRNRYNNNRSNNRGVSGSYLFPLLPLSGNSLFASVRNNVGQTLKAIGRAVDYPALSFNMNITAYRSIVSEVSIPELLLTTR